MKSLPTAPAPGTPVSSSLIRELIDAIRARTLLRGRGYRTRETPNGTFLDIDQAQPAKTKHLPGCFEYGGTVDQDGNKFYGRPYFMIGSRLYRAKDEDGAGGAREGIDYLDVTLDKGQIKAEVGHAEDYAELQEQADDKDHAIIPLYELGENGSPVADLRTMPLISSWEFST